MYLTFLRVILKLLRLSNVTFTTIKTDIDLSQVKISERTNDYIVTSLSPILNTPSVRRVVLAAYLDKCSESFHCVI